MAAPSEIAEIVKALADIYGPPETIKGYLWALEDLPVEAIEAGARALVKTNKWLPKPAELREAAETWQGQQQDAMIGDPGRMYWAAMGAFNASLRGDLSEQALGQNGPWRWYLHNRHQPIEDDPAAWGRACQEARQWMIDDGQVDATTGEYLV